MVVLLAHFYRKQRICTVLWPQAEMISCGSVEHLMFANLWLNVYKNINIQLVASKSQAVSS